MIPVGIPRIPGRTIQESYQDPVRSQKIIQEIQQNEAKMKKSKIFQSSANHRPVVL